MSPSAPQLITVKVHRKTHESLLALLRVRETMDQLVYRLINYYCVYKATDDEVAALKKIAE